MNLITDYSNNNSAGHWRHYPYDFDKGRDIARYIARKRYAWPGGYELFAITDDGGVLCNDCCKSEYWQIAHATKGDGWNVEGCGNMGECDDAVQCDHCSREIESAYS